MWGTDAWPMTGRDAELKAIARALTANGAAGVAITGAMGVGKSRLAREVLATRHPASVHWVAGTKAAQAIPLGAFVRWLPPEASDPARATNRVIGELVGRSGQRPVVVVDDAHLLDDTSAFLLDELGARRLATVVLTATTSTPVPPAVAALWRDGRLHSVDVAPLTRAEYDAFVEAVLPGPVELVARRQLWDLTRGNVQYLRHIVDQEQRAGRLCRVDGMWTWPGGSAVPAAVCELIEHQLGDLPDAVSEIVDLLSVAEPLTVRLLTGLVGPAALEQAEMRGLITVSAGDDATVRLVHPLFGKVRQLRAGHIRLRRLRAAVAARLADSDDAGRIVRRGRLLLESGLASSAADMLRAAEAALWRGDGAAALRFADAAHAQGGTWRTSLARAEALTLTGALDDARSVLAVDASHAAVACSASRARVLFLQRRSDDALAELDRCEAEYGGPDGSGVIDATRAFVRASGADLAAAVQSADAALSSGRVSDFSTLLATTAKVIAMGEVGRVGDLVSTAASAAKLGQGSEATSFLRFMLAEAQSTAWQMTGDLHAAEAVVAALADEEHPPHVYRWLSLMSGSASLAAGRVDAAVSQLRGALAPQRSEVLGGWFWRYHFDLAVALAIRGQSDEAKRCLARAGSLPHPDLAFVEPMEMLANAWVSASSGAVSRAIAQARTAAVTAATLESPAREVLCLQTATRFGDDTTRGRLDELVQVVGGARAGAAARHAAALTDGDGEGLMAVSQRYAAMGDTLSALDAAAQAATVFRRADRNGSALNATCRVRALGAECGDVHTPAVASAAAPPTFTGREREVVMLVGNGLTNREIAERLHLSIRTVEGHVYRASGRVGARDRNELARAIG